MWKKILLFFTHDDCRVTCWFIIKATQKASLGMYSWYDYPCKSCLCIFLVLPSLLHPLILNSFYTCYCSFFISLWATNDSYNVLAITCIPPRIVCLYQFYYQWLKLPWSDSVLVYFNCHKPCILYQSMTSPWQHHRSMRIIWQNGVADTPTN